VTSEQQSLVLELAEAGATLGEIVNEFLDEITEGRISAFLTNAGYAWESWDECLTKREESAAQEDDKPIPEKKEADDTDLLPCPDRSGYFLDRWCRPWAPKSQGRKGGPLKPDYYWYTAKDGRKRFVAGYRTRVKGERRRDTFTFFAMQRNKAERLRRGEK
jgi:hypothetical protein